MAEDLLVEGGKAIAAVCGRSLWSLREQMATYPDPLPVWRLRGGRLWARRDRLLSWCRRHPIDDRGWPLRGVQHPVPGLTVVRGRLAIGRVVRLLPRRVAQLLPWVATEDTDPIPAFRDASGTVLAYRDALLDWLERQSVTARAPRYLRRWESKLVSERKKRRKVDKRKDGSETARPRENQDATRVPPRCQEGSTDAPQKTRAAA